MMKIRPQLYSELKKYCTTALLSKLSDVILDNDNIDEWEISSLLEDFEMMKIAYVFEQLGGTLLYKGVPSQYVIITLGKSDNISNDIRLFWIHNNANGILPIYDIGTICVPPIMPKFVSTPKEDGTFVIEHLTNGVYIPINGMVFRSGAESQNMAREMNLEYYEDDNARHEKAPE
ncbi:MAG: hypothetical protein ACI3Z0_11410 [Candidatus Cryptobacteroides sp.]